MGSRRKGREYALQLLFRSEFSDPGDSEELIWESREVDKDTRDFARFLHDHYVENETEIDQLIRKHASNWKLERMATVDRNILRMAIAEFLFAETPRVVVIDEAIEVARKYSGDEATEFVNGILDSIHKDLKAEGGGQSDG
jgi:N utilization substance protein B